MSALGPPSLDARYAAQQALQTALIASMIALLGVVVATAANIFIVGHDTFALLNRQEGPVPRVVMITGTQFIRPDADRPYMFVVVVTPAGGIYPQGEAKLEGSSLSCKVSLGSVNRADDGRYDVAVVVTDAHGAKAIRSFVRKDLKRSRAGMADFPSPEHLRTVAHVTLQRSSKVKETLKKKHPERGCSG